MKRISYIEMKKKEQDKVFKFTQAQQRIKGRVDAVCNQRGESCRGCILNKTVHSEVYPGLQLCSKGAIKAFPDKVLAVLQRNGY